MAKVIRKGLALERKYKACEETDDNSMKLVLIGIIVFAMGAFLGVLLQGEVGVTVFLIAIIIALITGIVGVWNLQNPEENVDSLKAGIEGEQRVARLIAECLPDDYYGFQNVTIVYEGKSSELDMVVVGKTGVYIVETKNMNGTIRGNYEDKYWEQWKIGRGGNLYSKEFYSPVKQVGTHVYCLANYLKENGIRTQVNAMVYFSNPETDVQITSKMENIPVFSAGKSSGEQLRNHIMIGQQQLSYEKIKKIYKLLDAEKWRTK